MLTEMAAPNIAHRIYFFRERQVMLDSDLAMLYGVETRALNQAVRRNLDRFPDDFMFELNEAEFQVLISQFVISKNERRGGRQKRPLVFTEQGIAMLSGLLRSRQATLANINIMRTFVELRRTPRPLESTPCPHCKGSDANNLDHILIKAVSEYYGVRIQDLKHPSQKLCCSTKAHCNVFDSEANKETIERNCQSVLQKRPHYGPSCLRSDSKENQYRTTPTK